MEREQFETYMLQQADRLIDDQKREKQNESVWWHEY